MEKLVIRSISKDLIRILEVGKVPTISQCWNFTSRLQKIESTDIEVLDFKQALMNIINSCLESKDCVF